MQAHTRLGYPGNDLVWHKGLRTFSTEASSLRFPYMPERILITCKGGDANGKMFKRYYTDRDTEGDVNLWCYKSDCGILLKIFND